MKKQNQNRSKHTAVCGSIAIATILFLMTFASLSAQLSTVAEHVGNLNPADEAGWAEFVSGSVTSGAQTDSNVNPPVLAWNVTDPGDYSYLFYEVQPTTLEQYGLSKGWQVTMTLRVVSNPLDGSGYTWRQGAGFVVRDGSDLWVFDFVGKDPISSNDGIWYQHSNQQMAQLVSMNTTDQYHTYIFTYDPTYSGQITVTVDGSQSLTLSRTVVRDYSCSTASMWWAAGSTDGEGSANYSFTRFESVRVRGEEPNQPPTAVAGGPYTVTSTPVSIDLDPDTINVRSKGNWVTVYATQATAITQSVTLDSNGSADPENGSLDFAWTVYDADGNRVTTAVGQAPIVNLAPGTYTAVLVVTDEGGLTDEDSAEISVESPDLATVDPATLFLQGPESGLPAMAVRTELIDANTLMVKFPRADLVTTLIPEQLNTVTLAGALSGQDTIMVINRPEGKTK